MDRYLYKAKRLDNGEWVYGVPFEIEGKTVILISDNENILRVHYLEENMWNAEIYAIEVDSSTICQCTGLKDKNGKLIWENDIIECKNGKHNFQTQIEWDAYCAGFIFQDTETSAVGLDAIATNGLYSESKVIGNIFDNKDLLESEENN